jgi:hypothetical protein
MGMGPGRNFWITTVVDGAKTAQATGPRGKEGGFETEVRVWHHGESVVALRVHGFADKDGNLTLTATSAEGLDMHSDGMRGFTIEAHRNARQEVS